jgi:hypothetical protein
VRYLHEKKTYFSNPRLWYSLRQCLHCSEETLSAAKDEVWGSSPISTPQPRFPDSTAHDGEQHQHQVTLQQPEEYFQDEQIEEDCVSGLRQCLHCSEETLSAAKDEVWGSHFDEVEITPETQSSSICSS